MPTKVLTEGIVIVSEEIEDLIGNKVVGVLQLEVVTLVNFVDVLCVDNLAEVVEALKEVVETLVNVVDVAVDSQK